jgi:hypothetical protein
MRLRRLIPVGAIAAALTLVVAPSAHASTYSDTIVTLDHCHGYLDSETVDGASYVKGEFNNYGDYTCDFDLWRYNKGPVYVTSRTVATNGGHAETGWHWDGDGDGSVYSFVCVYVEETGDYACGGGW